MFSLQTRIFLIYIVIFLITAVIGVGFFVYVSAALEENIYINTGSIVTRMSQQMDSIIRPMEQSSLHLMSNRRFLTAVEDLSGVDRQNPANKIILIDAQNEISSQMLSYSLIKNYYRISLFNYYGDFFTSNYDTAMLTDGYVNTIVDLPWLDRLDREKGKIMVIAPYEDPWDPGEPEKVFSVARSIRGGPPVPGFIEVQQPYGMLEEIFATEEREGVSVCAVTRDGSVLYETGFAPSLLEHYRGLAHGGELELINNMHNPVTGVAEVLGYAASDYSGIAVLLIYDRDMLLSPITTLGFQVAAICLVIVVASCLYVIFQSRMLTAPLRQLKREMDVTRLETLPENTPIDSPNNEIVSLGNAFYDLKERLGLAIERELQLRSLHMQASFDALQARVNPHFLYNILGLISNQSAMTGNDEVCEICDSIASMLRYSVAISKRAARLEEELDHVGNYIFLMQKRFEHRLHYHVEVDEAILGVQLPKMVLQPLVENAIEHGFESSGGTMELWVRGWQEKDGWRVSITDNGQGFSEQALADLGDKISRCTNETLSQAGGELGGMGIINIYARLKLFDPGGFTMVAGNTPEGGARIVLGCSRILEEL